MPPAWTTKVKKLNPKKGYNAAYIQLPWNTHEDLIGHEVEIEEVTGGFLVKVDCEKFKLNPNADLITRLSNLEEEVKKLKNTPKEEWARPDSNRRPPPCKGDVITD